MRRLMAFLVVFFLTATPLVAQSNWGGRTSAGEWAFSRGDFDRAEEEFRAALEIAQDFPEGDVRLEESLRNLGRFYEHQSRFNKAEPMFLLLLAVEEHRFGPDSPKILDTLVALARVAVPSGDHPVALESLERFVTIADNEGITDDDRLRVVLASLTRIYLIEEKGDKAVEAQRRTAMMALANPGLETEEQAAALESQAQLEIRFGDPHEAPALINQAAELRRDGDPSAVIDAVYLDAVRTALAEGESEAAASLFEAFRIAEPEAGTTMETARLDADIAWATVRRDSANLIDLQAVTQDPEDLRKASDALTLLDTLQQAEQPPDPGAHLETLARLARVTVMQGDLEAATNTQKQLVNLLTSTTGPSSQPTRTALRAEIDLLLAQQRNAEAADTNETLISALEQAWGEDDARLLPSLRLQYDLLKEARRKKEAKAIKKRIKRLD
ncbi:MAG: tetratricopeptide repeat protein [Acidobacteriota bacterium]